MAQAGVGEGKSQWKEQDRPRYRGVGWEISDELWKGMVWLERRESVCFEGGRRGRRDLGGPEGLRYQLRNWGLDPVIWDSFF